MKVARPPAYEFWVPGSPRSLQASGPSDRYRAKVADAARLIIPAPLADSQIDIDVIWAAKRSLRADVDNVAKPILDALKGIVYEDDRQVRALRVAALPLDLPFSLGGTWMPEALSRVLKGNEFLIRIFAGRWLGM